MTRTEYLEIAAALKRAAEDATGSEAEGVRLAAESIARLFESKTRAFDYKLFMQNALGE